MQNIIFYSLAIGLLLVSFMKDKKKTKQSLMKAWKSFENILPQMLSMITLIGVIVSVLSPETISKIIGNSSGWYGVIIAALLGSVTLIPAFVAFPLAAILLQNGAGYMQLSAFISTLTMVGVITFPLEIKFFGKKFTILRNSLAFTLAFVVAFIIGKVVV
ncbi:MAG: permease [Tissierellaceae bacterium]|nr:permease [Tissierellaceae bacterium]